MLLAAIRDYEAYVANYPGDAVVESEPEQARHLAGRLAEIEADTEVTGETRSWIPAIGTVEGTFPLPPADLPGLQELTVQTDSSGLAFYRCMLAERASRSHDERVLVRANMKARCPLLLAAYLQRLR